MRKTKGHRDYEISGPLQGTYGGEGCAERERLEPEGYGGRHDDEWEHDEDYDEEYDEEPGKYGSGLKGYMEGRRRQEGKRVGGAMDSTFFLNGTGNVPGRADAARIHDNFRKYVADVQSGNEAARQAAREGACRDLEFFIMNIITRKFSTYVGNDRSFYEDLMQAGRMGIIMALPKYDPDRSMPTTYFFNAIRHEMVLQANLMKHGARTHTSATRRKIEEVDRMFEKYGRRPALHDYMYSIDCPFGRIMDGLAEMKAESTGMGVDTQETGPLADSLSSMRSPEESAISNMNYSKIIQVARELEPREEIIQCFLELSDSRIKTSELSQKYGLSPSEITEGVSNLKNLLRYNPDIRKMYPELFRMEGHGLSERVAYMPVEEGNMVMDNAMDFLEALSGGWEEPGITMG